MKTANSFVPSRRSAIALLAAALAFAPLNGYSRTIDERPSGVEMAADIVLVRPMMIGATVLGTGVFILGSPFALIGGNLKETADVFIATPFKAAFLRCLGCTEKQFWGAP
jgi:hypothetical protein